MVAEAYPSLARAAAQAAARPRCPSSASGWRSGVAGSWLLARLIKRRTRGLEPAEIAALADQREALLHSIREGVVAVGDDGRSRCSATAPASCSTCRRRRRGPPARRPDLDPAVRELLLGDGDVRDAS